MSEHKVTVDVYGNWYGTPPRYRVYVDNDLLTERDFIWPGTDVYIREHILVNLAPGKHTLRIEKATAWGKIVSKNVVVDGVASSYEFITTE